MPDDRRNRRRDHGRGPGRRPAGSRGRTGRASSAGRGRTPRSPRTPVAAASSASSASSASGSLSASGGARDGVRRPRLTGRAAVLVMVLAVLAVSYASSLRAYLDQRSEIDQLRAEIAGSKSDIDDLEREKDRWKDPAYVAAQARERFGYVKPGETPFVVVDENGDPVDADTSLSDPDAIGQPGEPRAWYDEVWDSLGVAGHPPTEAPDPPATEIDGSDEPTGE